MSERATLARGVLIGVLLIMVWKSAVWLVLPHPDATTALYVLNVVNLVACGLTAYATWRPSEGAQQVLKRVSGRLTRGGQR